VVGLENTDVGMKDDRKSASIMDNLKGMRRRIGRIRRTGGMYP